MELLQWWNLIFLLPAMAALLYLLLLALGALPAEGHDADVDLDVDPDLHIEVHSPHTDIHPGNLPNHTPSVSDPFRGALSLIGVGRVPLSLVLMSFLFLWGFFGWLANQVFGSVIAAPALFIWPSLVVALVGASTLTRFFAARLGRLMPATESYGASTRELVGRIADVRYALTETSGTVQLYDEYGSIHEVPARVMHGESVIPAGERVVLWRFDERAGTYFAVQDDAINGIEVIGPQRVKLPNR
jgi:membrane protein implicated in regulation of membrane protease activity